MANPLVLTNAQILVGSAWTGTAPGLPGNQTVSGTIASPVDISQWVVSISTPFTADQKDSTTMGSGGWSSMALGIKHASVSIGVIQDYSASAFNATIWPYFDTGVVMYMDVKPTSASRSATNPSYVMAVLVASYTPVEGKVGDLVAPTLSWAVQAKAVQLTS